MILFYPLLFTGTFGGAMLSAILHPIDLLKTRMQMRSELVSTNLRWYQVAYQKQAYVDLRHILWKIRHREGFRVLRIGMTPLFIIGGFNTTWRIASYEYAYKTSFLSSEDQDVLMLRSVVFCGCTGIISQLIMNPLHLIKTKLQYWSMCQSTGTTYIRSSNTFSMGIFIYEKFGWRGFGIGWSACVPRGFIQNVSQLVSYEMCKNHLQKANPHPSVDELMEFYYYSAVCSGIVSTIITNPFDIVLTRLHIQPYFVNMRGLFYHDFGDVCAKILRHEGYQGFFKGLVFFFFKNGIMSAMSLLYWDIWKDRFTDIFVSTAAPAFMEQTFIDSAFRVANQFEF